MKRSNCVAKKLFIIWGMLFFFVGLAGRIYIELSTRHDGYPPTEVLGGYHLAITAFVLFVFCPLLFFVQRYAKQEKAKGILIFSRILLVHHLLWLIGSIAQMIIEISR